MEGIFQRYELKYLVDRPQRQALEELIARRMVPDVHGESTICNVYYDTPDFRLVRRSLEKPIYKEKLRARSYGPALPEGTVFLELKKKYDGVVYKRRIELKAREAEDYMSGLVPMPVSGQIAREIGYFREFYRDLAPAVYLCYDRTAWFDGGDGDLRLTFDRNICWRQYAVSLTAPAGGRPILPKDMSLLEVKAARAIPFRLAEAMSRLGIRQVTFSKYGEAYKTILAGESRQGGEMAYV